MTITHSHLISAARRATQWLADNPVDPPYYFTVLYSGNQVGRTKTGRDTKSFERRKAGENKVIVGAELSCVGDGGAG